MPPLYRALTAILGYWRLSVGDHPPQQGFERVTTNELASFLAMARGSAGEVRSMLAVVKHRPRLQRLVGDLQEIRALAESCARQLTAWTGSIEASGMQGKRHLTPRQKERRELAAKVIAFRLNFLRSLSPQRPLYSWRAAREARGEAVEESRLAHGHAPSPRCRIPVPAPGTAGTRPVVEAAKHTGPPEGPNHPHPLERQRAHRGRCALPG